jgi:putative heme-binding domain-containing protein
MIDWYDKNQCHNNDMDAHDRSNGRIFKIVYRDTRWTPVDVGNLSDEKLVELQVNKNEWWVRHARRALQERGPNPKVHRALLKILDQNPDGGRKLRALWALHVTGGLTEPIALAQLRSADEYVRAWTVQLLAEDKHVSAAALKEFVRLAREDASPVVRLYVASALQRIPPEDRWDAVEALDARAEDADDHNLPLMYWYAAEPLPANDLNRALRMAEAARIPRMLHFTVRRIAALGTPKAFAAITDSLNRAADDSRRLDILNGLSLALKGRRSVDMPAGWSAVEARLNESPGAEIRTLTQSLSLIFGSPGALAALHKTLVDETADLPSRGAAMESLLAARDGSLAAILQRLLGDPHLRAPALRGLATYDDPQTPAAILAVYQNLSPAERRDALNTLAARVGFAKALLASVARGAVPTKDLTADLVRQLRSLKDDELERQILRVWGISRDSTADKKAEIDKYKKIYWLGGSSPGDSSRGRAVFTRTCQQCHTLFGVGGKVGPDLTGSNRADLDYILQNIVDPNAVIPNEYRASNLETKDGRSITAIITRQDDKSVTAVTANEVLVIPRDEIQSLTQSALSMMPEGLLQSLTDQEVRDLIYYLGRPAQVPLP